MDSPPVSCRTWTRNTVLDNLTPETTDSDTKDRILVLMSPCLARNRATHLELCAAKASLVSNYCTGQSYPTALTYSCRSNIKFRFPMLGWIYKRAK